MVKTKYYTISFLNDAIESYSKSQDEKRVKIRLEAYFAEFKSKDDAKKQFDLLERIEEAYAIVEPLLGAEYPRDRNLKADKKEVGKIKDFLDSIKSLQFFLKPLLSAEIFDEKDLGFYNQLEGYYEEIDSIGHLYNKVRNYLTGKIYSKEKFKLNFENSTLLKGWDENREVANLCVIFREDQKYYLGVMDKENNTILSDIPKVKPNELFYEKMVYKLIPTPHMQLPRIIFSSDNLSIYNPSKSILKIREAKSFKEGKNFKLKDCHKFIDFYKESISKNEDWSRFDFKFSKTSSYENISEFYREVERQGYNLDFKKVSKFYIDSLVEDGKLYLFQIYNKDFSIFSKGKPNLHTIYFRSLFSKENLKDVCLKLNGEAEMFFRKKSINYDEKKKREGHHPELFEKLKYPILKDKRYSEDKFQFHLPISLNFKSKERLNFNLKVNEFLKRNKDINIIGIDRGERNLLYLVMINQKGEILKQTLLDSMQSGKGRPEINYKEKLQEKEIERDKARKSWGTVENIKELKEGYLSIVIHQISKLMVENNAIVVLEDLNIGFKRGRQKVERQVYQKFEKMLIDKLNFLVFKENKPTEPGGVLKAYQLTDEFQSFEKLSKQTGFLFYVPSWNTSKIDPRTGFIDFLHPAYENIEKAKQWINKFDSIRFNSKMDWFEFTADTRKFSENLMLGKNRVWVICTTNVERYFTSKTANSSIQYNSIQITEKLKELFVDIPFSNGQDLKPEILRKNDAVFFKSLLFYIKTTLSLRQNNGKKGEEEKDFILSPVVDSKGRFFNSLEASDDEPKDADANGAYHIALKGLMNLLVLNETKEENLSRPKWKIKNKDWLEFVWERNR